MYSRNLTFDNLSQGVRLTPNKNIEGKSSYTERVPVRSFSDGFAYERFNRMGDVKQHSSSTAYPKVQDNSTTDQTPQNKMQDEYASEDAVESVSVIDDEIQEQSQKKDEVSILTKFKRMFDSDTIIIMLAVIMILFSDNATNDKLTPFALLAILFL